MIVKPIGCLHAGKYSVNLIKRWGGRAAALPPTRSGLYGYDDTMLLLFDRGEVFDDSLGEAIAQFSVAFGAGFQGRCLLIGLVSIAVEAILLVEGP
jgi:hypothetical protein